MGKSAAAKKGPARKPATAPVAYEDRRDNFERKVERILVRMGLSEGDAHDAIARHGSYVARARDAELDPQIVASTIYQLDNRPPPREPDEPPSRHLAASPGPAEAAPSPAPPAGHPGVGMWAGEDRRPSERGYYVVGPDDVIVSGPHPTRYLAQQHPMASRGYIQFEAGQPGKDVVMQSVAESSAEEGCSHTHPPSVPTAPCATGSGDPDARPQPGGGAEDCGCRHAAPLARPLRWHRDDSREGGYYADSALGRFTLREQSSNRRQGILAWGLRIDEHELTSADTASEGKAWAETYGTMVPAAAAGEPVVIRDAGKMSARPMVGGKSLAEGCRPFMRTYRDPDACEACMVVAKEIGPVDDPKKVFELLRGYYMKQHQEVYVVVMLNVRDELVGIEEVARGQRSQVAVDFDDIYRPVNMAAASSFWAVHGHPSGTEEPSRRDRQLTKQIEAAMKHHPDTKFRGHVVIGQTGYALA